MLQRRSCPDESSRDSVTVLARDWLPISGGKGFGNKTVWPWSFSCSQVSSHLGLPFNWNFQVANLSKPCLNVIVLYKSSPSLLHIFYAQNTSKPEHPSKTAISAPAFGEKIRLWYLFPCIYSRWGDCNCNLCFPFFSFSFLTTATASSCYLHLPRKQINHRVYREGVVKSQHLSWNSSCWLLSLALA